MRSCVPPRYGLGPLFFTGYLCCGLRAFQRQPGEPGQPPHSIPPEQHQQAAQRASKKWAARSRMLRCAAHHQCPPTRAALPAIRCRACAQAGP